MDTTYVRRKEWTAGGSAVVILIANIALVKKLLKSDGCIEDALCVIPVVLLFLSMGILIVKEVLMVILANREKRNETIRKTLQGRTENTNGGIDELQTDSERRIVDLRKREKTNDCMNSAILGLTTFIVILNFVINGMELR